MQISRCPACNAPVPPGTGRCAMRTNAEIHNDNYLTLMNQEEYINPFTNEPETGSNQWQYRWVTAGGEEFYTDNEDHNPNVWGLLNASDWRRTAVRPRFPQ